MLCTARSDQTEKSVMVAACSTHGGGERRDAYRVVVGKPEVKRPLGRPRRRWEDNVKMDIKEVGLRGMDWIELAQGRTGGGRL
jgi:hypothetical protein